MIVRHPELPLEYNAGTGQFRWTAPARGRKVGWFTPGVFFNTGGKMYRVKSLKRQLANIPTQEVPEGVTKLGLRWKVVVGGEYRGLFKTLAEATAVALSGSE